MTKYNIVTYGNNYFLVEFVNCCENEDDALIDDFSTDEILYPDDENSSEAGLKMLTLGSTYSCNMRIIVMYTPAVAALLSNELNMIQSHIDQANQILSNSGVNETWELAYAGLTNYTEVYIPEPGDGRYTDRDRFRIDGDGYMDEVHDLREKYSADICVLLTECQYQTQCGGVAAAIDANYSYAFCLCHTYSWTISSFSHEIGHLLACRHQNDYSTTPYSYGHAFVNNVDSTKTIMGNIWDYAQLPYWSNPDITYNGYAIGTANFSDCSRVIEQEIPEKVAFSQPETSVTISSSDVENMDYGEVISEQSITVGAITLSSGEILKIHTAETALSNGFTVESGAEFEVIPEAVYDCP